MIPAWLLDVFARGHARGRGRERGAHRRGAAVAGRAASSRGRHRRRAPADGHRDDGHAGSAPADPAGRRVGGRLRRADGLVRLPGGSRRAGQRFPRAGRRALRAASPARRGHAVHVPRPDRAGIARRRHERDGRRGRERDRHPWRCQPSRFVFTLLLVGYSVWGSPSPTSTAGRCRCPACTARWCC